MSALHANVSLRDLNTLRLRSKAAWFVSATSVDEVQSSVREARAKGVSLIPLGGGSNVILGPEIHALVVHINILGRELIEDAQDQVVVRVGAGEGWHETVLWAHQNGYYGLENLALIPRQCRGCTRAKYWCLRGGGRKLHRAGKRRRWFIG